MQLLISLCISLQFYLQFHPLSLSCDLLQYGDKLVSFELISSSSSLCFKHSTFCGIFGLLARSSCTRESIERRELSSRRGENVIKINSNDKSNESQGAQSATKKINGRQSKCPPAISIIREKEEKTSLPLSDMNLLLPLLLIASASIFINISSSFCKRLMRSCIDDSSISKPFLKPATRYQRSFETLLKNWIYKSNENQTTNESWFPMIDHSNNSETILNQIPTLKHRARYQFRCSFREM